MYSFSFEAITSLNLFFKQYAHMSGNILPSSEKNLLDKNVGDQHDSPLDHYVKNTVRRRPF